MSNPTQRTTSRSVLLFWPNLIGYGRIVFTITSWIIMILSTQSSLMRVTPQESSPSPSRPLLLLSPSWNSVAVLLYMLSFIGDLFDGWVARKFNQTSSFGNVLDMVTDRCSTLGLFYILGQEYAVVDTNLSLPFFRIIFLLLAVLDVSSHWFQTYASMLVGLHHKSESANLDRNILVQWFYQYYYFFGYLCVGAEFTYMLLYARIHKAEMLLSGMHVILSSSIQLHWIDVGLMICIPGCILKQIVNIVQLTSSAQAIARYDAEIINQKASDKQK